MNKLIQIKELFHYFVIIVMISFVTTLPIYCYAQTNLVGSMEGEVMVTPLGTASFNIPIEITPGTKGIQPNLSITYNSALERGLLGVGWTISGLSSITRTQRNNYFDGSIGSVNFDGNDRYVLDGSRLIKLSEGNYATTGATYGMEIEDFTRVTLHGTPNTFSQYFTEVTSDGTFLEYGNTNDSKQTTSGYIYGWWINKVTDPDGNYMNFEYTGTSGEKLPHQILYTGNTITGLGTYARIVFQYIQDPRPHKFWIGGSSITNSHLLSNICVYYGSDLVRSYSFIYDHH